jgi:ABC-2 type transport system permease protein
MMGLQRVRAVALKELRHITRDLRILLLVTVSPALLGLTFSYVFSFDVDEATLAVLDTDRTGLSRRYVSALASDGDLRVIANVATQDALEALLLRGEAEVALTIPKGFASAVQSGEPARVQAVVDGLDTIAARTNVGYLEARTAAHGAELMCSASVPWAKSTQVRSLAWYNVTLDSLSSMVPGMMGVVLQMPALSLALALSREKESGSFESLITTPVRGAEYLVGKLAAYVASGLVSSILALAVAVLWFRVPFRGSVAVFLLLAGLFLLASMGLGLLVGNFASSQQTAMVIMLLLIFIPSFFLSGLLLPVDRTSRWAQLTGLSLPATHFIGISRSLFLKGSELSELRRPAAWLAGMGGSLLAINLLLFRKRT